MMEEELAGWGSRRRWVKGWGEGGSNRGRYMGGLKVRLCSTAASKTKRTKNEAHRPPPPLRVRRETSTLIDFLNEIHVGRSARREAQFVYQT